MKKLLIALCLLLIVSCAAVGHAESHVHSGGTATCEALAVCSECGQRYGHLAGHNWGGWTSDGGSTHTRTCRTNASHKETRYHMGGASTCTKGAVCALCGATHDEPLGHVPVTNPGVEPTCTSSGWTDGTDCSRCGAVLSARKYRQPKSHNYPSWEPISDTQHLGVCRTCFTGTVVDCTFLEVTIGEEVQRICPICGDCGTLVFPILLDTWHDALPIGRLLVRSLEEPFEGVLYAFTVVGSAGGTVHEFDVDARITLPVDFPEDEAFRLIYVAVTPETEEAPRTEEWIDTAYTLKNGKLTFHTENTGLFLLLAAE